MKHKSDLKHTSTAKARAEDREKKAIEGLRLSRMSCGWLRKSFRHLWKSYAPRQRRWIGPNREASEAESSMECLAEECDALHGDLERQEAMVSQRDGVIAELRDEACTLWASGWLAFRRRDAKCHAPIPGPTRLANPNWFRGAKPYTGTPCYLFIFFLPTIIYYLQMNYHRVVSIPKIQVHTQG